MAYTKWAKIINQGQSLLQFKLRVNNIKVIMNVLSSKEELLISK